MTIISISIPKNMLSEMDSVQKDMGFEGRSELVRAALRMFVADKKEKENLIGDLLGVLIVSHDEESEPHVTTIKHKFKEILTTQLHCKLGKKKCLELFVVDGGVNQVREMAKMFHMHEDMDYVKLIIP